MSEVGSCGYENFNSPAAVKALSQMPLSKFSDSKLNIEIKGIESGEEEMQKLKDKIKYNPDAPKTELMPCDDVVDISDAFVDMSNSAKNYDVQNITQRDANQMIENLSDSNALSSSDLKSLKDLVNKVFSNADSGQDVNLLEASKANMTSIARDNTGAFTTSEGRVFDFLDRLSLMHDLCLSLNK